jgi:hypothetical protein
MGWRYTSPQERGAQLIEYAVRALSDFELIIQRLQQVPIPED